MMNIQKVIGLCSIAFMLPFTASALNVGDTIPSQSISILGKPGKKVNLAKVKAKYIYIDFWASWCASCVYSMPKYSKLARDLRKQGLKVVGISLDKTPQKAIAVKEKYKIPFTLLYDDNKQLAKAYKLPKVPTSYLIDANKKVIKVFPGYKNHYIDDIYKIVG